MMEGGEEEEIMAATAANYYSKDFEWDHLRQEIENNPCHAHHLLPFPKQDDQQHTLLCSPQEDDDSEAWSKFHTRHSTGKFFKERRYLLKEFPELASCGGCSTILEIGCGNGSTALAILRGNKSISLYACDCSKEALERAKENIEAANINLAKERFYPFQCDFSASRFPNWLACTACHENFFQKQSMCISDARSCSKQDFPSAKNNSCIGGVDFVTLIFTLSAVPLHRMSRAITECFSVLKPGGLLLFRDYGLYDMTMLRFKPEQRVGYREYMRSDGTRSYFFCLDRVRDLFCATGFTELELEYCCVQSVNRQNGKIMQRVWIHGKFQRPHVHVGS
ncbi:tRNA N(3)-methylcytidine methyltransferase METTL6 isoform X1 [Capsicum galapagoense]